MSQTPNSATSGSAPSLAARFADLLADGKGRVVFGEVSPDWLQRPEAETILHRLPRWQSAA